MAERPILFSGPMVRAILAGQKTQTRRVVKDQPEFGEKYAAHDPWFGEDGLWRWMHGVVCRERTAVRCPYGVVGDRLWVRETWGTIVWSVIYGDRRAPRTEVVYRAGPHPFDRDLPHGWNAQNRWKPSIHMPRLLSRLTLDVTGVRVEPLQDISESDAIAEGVDAVSMRDVPRQATPNRRTDFAHLWDKINAKRAPWASNPWVWVLEFKRMPPSRITA